MVAYCFKCRDRRGIRETQPITLKNGRSATWGLCDSCGTKVFRIIKTELRSLRVPSGSGG